jgi:hypothetical protein
VSRIVVKPTSAKKDYSGLEPNASPIFPCTLGYKTRKGLSFQKLFHKAGSRRETVCIENKAEYIYLPLYG